MLRSVCLVAVCVAFVGWTSVAQAADAPNLEGTYACQGTSPMGATYQGTVVIGKQGEQHSLQWSIANGRERYSGIGLLEGNVLSVAWSAGGAVGLVSYKVSAAGPKVTLTGRWAIVGSRGVFTETLEKR